MKIRVGITGASGFIGNYLLEQLLQNGFLVKVLTRSKAKFPKDVLVVQGDLQDKDVVNSFLDNIDIVVHLAGRQLPPDELFFQDNVAAANTLVTCMLNFPIKQTIYLSTVSVYGDKNRGINKESNECFPATYYGFSKYLAEKTFQYWESVSGETLTILRPFNIYGKGSTKGVIFNMLNNVKQKKQITIYGDGSQSRDFLYVSDVVSAIMIAIEKQTPGIFNLGTGKAITLLELVRQIEKTTASEVNIKFEKSEFGKTNAIRYSLDNAKKILNWNAKITLEKGLQELII